MYVELIDVMASDESVVRAAKVSTIGAASVDSQASEKLINYLIRENHMSPFEHNSFTFLVHAPIFVTREMLRHRIGTSFNEESGRYRELDTEFYYPTDRPLRQVGKTGDYNFESGNELREDTIHLFREAFNITGVVYKDLLEMGVAKEVARMVLPVGLYSSMYFTVNARSLMHFLGLRTAPNAMWEIKEIAKAMEESFAIHMPMTYNAWVSTRRVAV